MSAKGGPVLTLSLPGGGLPPAPGSYATDCGVPFATLLMLYHCNFHIPSFQCFHEFCFMHYHLHPVRSGPRAPCAIEKNCSKFVHLKLEWSVPKRS